MLDFDFIEWDDPDSPRGNIQHVAEHGLTRGDVEQVLYDPASVPVTSRSSGRPALIGETASDETIIVIYERYQDAGYVTIRPVTAYRLEP